MKQVRIGQTPEEDGCATYKRTHKALMGKRKAEWIPKGGKPTMQNKKRSLSTCSLSSDSEEETLDSRNKVKNGFSIPFGEEDTTKLETVTRRDVVELKRCIKVHTGLLQELDRKMAKIMRHLANAGAQNHGPSQQQNSSARALMPLNISNTVKTEPLKEETKDEPEEKFVTEKGVNLLAIRAADPVKYALSLMDVIFTEEEMATCCYESNKRTTKPGLPCEKVKLLEDCVARKYGSGVLQQNVVLIKKQCNQKCIDRANKKKLDSN